MKEVSAMVVLSAKSLATCSSCNQLTGGRSCHLLICPYLSNPANVLFSVLRREAKVLVQAKSHVVAVESVGLETKVEEVLLESDGDGRLAGSGEASEPDSATLLLAKVGALSASEAGVPGNVAMGLVSMFIGMDFFVGGVWRGNLVEDAPDGVGDLRCHFDSVYGMSDVDE